ncbi:hypothetical protein [Cellulosimicrobium marinum]|uniref:hypothetical protein n=1 Tax=Cellulosimicrobium marinum TaxID=1638992 RepID=UPI001E65C5B7|nr:hypothetical protein [Cellulosimicrobium marinum]MCB7137498.1 hypothetical protein [Cellulosimicrobium marinum]
MTVEADELVEMVRDVFTTMPSGQEVRFLDARAVDDDLQITVAGRPGDNAGPYGIKIELPQDEDYAAASDHAASTRREWCEYVLTITVEAYLTRSFAASDPSTPITWLLP